MCFLNRDIVNMEDSGNYVTASPQHNLTIGEKEAAHLL